MNAIGEKRPLATAGKPFAKKSQRVGQPEPLISIGDD
jgi:hypothetical protein